LFYSVFDLRHFAGLAAQSTAERDTAWEGTVGQQPAQKYKFLHARKKLGIFALWA
jgi:hypothetical protein